jgi:hypothetical protein
MHWVLAVYYVVVVFGYPHVVHEKNFTYSNQDLCLKSGNAVDAAVQANPPKQNYQIEWQCVPVEGLP